MRPGSIATQTSCTTMAPSFIDTSAIVATSLPKGEAMATPRARLPPSAAVKGPRFQPPESSATASSRILWRLVRQQAKAQFVRIMLPGVGHFVKKSFVEKVVHRMPDRAPEADDGWVEQQQMRDAPVGDRVRLPRDTFRHRKIGRIRLATEPATSRTFAHGFGLQRHG